MTKIIAAVVLFASLAVAQTKYVDGNLTVEGTLNHCGADTGIGNAFVCANPSGAMIAAYRDGVVYSFRATHSNSGAATLAIDGLAATTIKKFGVVDLLLGDIANNTEVVVKYNGTSGFLEMQTPVANAASTAVQLFNMASCAQNTAGLYDVNISYGPLSGQNCLGDSQAVANFNSTVTQSYVVIHTLPPANWGLGAIDVKINWFQQGGGSDGNIQWNAQSYCVSAGATTTGTPVYNSAGTVTVAQPNFNVEGEAAVIGINHTGCTATSRVYIKVFNSLQGTGGTTSAIGPQVEGIAITFR